MSVGVKSVRTQTWLESLGEWTWPGQRVPATAEAMPPSWVPAFPPSAPAPAADALPASWQRARRVTIAVLLCALALVSAALIFHRELGIGASAVAPTVRDAPVASREATLLASPPLKPLSRDHAGSTIEQAVYPSVSLHREGSFYVYLPPGYKAHGTHRYPVLYLLHGNDQSATAFLEVGLQTQLDSLIAAHRVPPMIAVMIQGGRGANNWRNLGNLHYESYVLEAQEIVDRILPTIPTRAARAIAGDSMGGYGAMELTLDNPARFGVVESWIGFFNGLEEQLRIDRPQIHSLGLHAFLYGAAEDKIANPAEDAPFAAQLRAGGAEATSVIFPGEHNLETVEAHLQQMLLFAGHWLDRRTDWPDRQ